MNPPSSPAVACILVNWNNAADTSECLAALGRQDYPSLTVVVVDNASTDGSLAVLQAAHPWATYIANPENAGFPKACNVGARHPLAAAADFLWLLNNDTIAPPDTLRQMVAVAQDNPVLGIVGSVLYYQHNPALIQAWGGGHVNRWTAYNTHYHAPADFGPDTYITFASALIRGKLYRQLGGLFEGAFMYFEDADFCLRAQRSGWQLGVAPETAILHKEGGTTKSRNCRTDRMVTHAGLLFLSRHSPAPPISYFCFLALRFGRRLASRDWQAIQAVLAGTRHFLTSQAKRPAHQASAGRR
jgi:GT2 family glycosyltransferase